MANIIGNKDKEPNYDLSKSIELVCADCGHNVFISAVMFRKISKIVTGTPKDATIPIEVYCCGECGEIQQELLPPELKLKEVE